MMFTSQVSSPIKWISINGFIALSTRKAQRLQKNYTSNNIRNPNHRSLVKSDITIHTSDHTMIIFPIFVILSLGLFYLIHRRCLLAIPMPLCCLQPAVLSIVANSYHLLDLSDINQL
jgi:hypothetical protein